MAEKKQDERCGVNGTPLRVRMDAHDLKAPIANIVSICQFLRDHEQDREDLSHYLGVIARNAEGISQLVQGLLEQVGLATEGRPPVWEKIDPGTLVEEALDQLSWRIHEKRLSIHMKLARLPDLWADSEQIRRVFLNLLDNAVRQSPEAGEIRITGEPHMDGARFTISDQGAGVAEQIGKNLFSAWEPKGKSGASDGGTGLGLRYCQDVVKAHGGAISYESEPGRGARFSFQLPLGSDRD